MFRGVDIESTGYVMLHIYIPRYMFRCFRGDCTTLPIMLRDTYTTTCKGSLFAHGIYYRHLSTYQCDSVCMST